ncbi:hypothetical protein SynBIOSE41_03666 [Synechococcus sp. BIOS-E4-1]|nr:hypothetical protein SynBIOSE41_03666 [Synechococcus sp. BIOS-E4-1]
MRNNAQATALITSQWIHCCANKPSNSHPLKATDLFARKSNEQ